MRLTLSILRCPPSAPPQTRTLDGGEINLGRGPDNDWVLPDPERVLSKRHCAVAYHGGEWQVADLSINGTFLNGESEPIGQGLSRRLRDGDRIRFGAYELEARIGPAPASPGPAWSDPFGHDPYGVDPFAPAQPLALPEEPASAAISLPADFDPLAPEHTGESWRLPTQPDHSAAITDAFRPPPVVSALPDDWAEDLLPGSAPVRGVPPGPLAPEVPVAMAPPPAPDTALLTALLRGAGLPEATVADPAALMEQVGAMLRAMVSGLRQALIARASIKGEFRIERTMISARGNNPLKFSADDDDALAALVGDRRRSDMPPPQAVADALRDMRLHELATMAAMQAAVCALVAGLDPAAVMREAGSGALPMQRKARAWDALAALHAKVARNLADDFDSVFGKSFARAYEQAQREIAGKDNPIP